MAQHDLHAVAFPTLDEAVYGGSEGLGTLVLERQAPGGPAASSMRIENYLGFPTGLTGSDLVDRAVIQVDKLGAELSIPAPVVHLSFEEGYPVLHLEGGDTVAARCLLLGTGTDARGFICTGPLATRSPAWPLRREPFLLETNRPGVFAAGDVRADSARRRGRRRRRDDGEAGPRAPRDHVNALRAGGASLRQTPPIARGRRQS